MHDKEPQGPLEHASEHACKISNFPVGVPPDPPTQSILRGPFCICPAPPILSAALHVYAFMHFQKDGLTSACLVAVSLSVLNR